jgi:hypothetical protein
MTEPGGSDAGHQTQQIVDRAMRDPDFRTRLLENPREAVLEALGTSIPAGTSIRVVEEQPGEVILVIPARSIEPGTGLSDEDLEAAAGGIVNTYSLGPLDSPPCFC